MDQSQTVQDLLERYEAGERNFARIQLRQADLRGINLSGANLEQADLRGANLIRANLSGSQLEDSYLNEASLDDANLDHCGLSRAILLKTSLINANLKRADLTKTYLSGSLLLNSNLEEANLAGAYLSGVQIFGANCRKAYYTKSTYFDISLKPGRLGMRKLEEEMLETSIEKILSDFNYLGSIIGRYIGKTMMAKYWENARPKIQWLENFSINSPDKLIYFTGKQTVANFTQRQDCQDWGNQFVQNSSAIVHNLPSLIQSDHLIFQLPWNNSNSIENEEESESLFVDYSSEDDTVE